MLLGVGVGVAVGVVVLGVVVVQDVVVVVVVVVHAVSLAHRVVKVGVAFVLAVLRGVGRRPRRVAVTLRGDDGHLRRQHHLLLLRHAAAVQAARVVAKHTGAVRLHICRKRTDQVSRDAFRRDESDFQTPSEPNQQTSWTILCFWKTTKLQNYRIPVFSGRT